MKDDKSKIALWHIDQLEHPESDTMTIKEAVLWILENTEWATDEN